MTGANMAILSEQAEAADWELWEFASEMVWWAQAFEIQFFSKLGGCPTPVIGYANSHAGNLGSYRLTRNSFGLACEINMNRQYIHRPRWSVLATLFHEMVHAYEHSGKINSDAVTRNWFHKAWFKDYMWANGFTCGDNGAHEEVDLKGDFFWFIQRHGIDLSDPEMLGISMNGNGLGKVRDMRRKKESRTTTWSCDCMEIKLPKKLEDFDATCNHCKVTFQPMMED